MGKRLTFHDNALDVEIAQKDIDCKAEAEAFDASSGAVSRTCNLQTGDCMGDASREQGTVPSQLQLTVDSDGTRGFSAPVWGSMKPERGRGLGGRRALRCSARGRARAPLP